MTQTTPEATPAPPQPVEAGEVHVQGDVSVGSLGQTAIGSVETGPTTVGTINVAGGGPTTVESAAGATIGAGGNVRVGKITTNTVDAGDGGVTARSLTGAKVTGDGPVSFAGGAKRVKAGPVAGNVQGAGVSVKKARGGIHGSGGVTVDRAGRIRHRGPSTVNAGTVRAGRMRRTQVAGGIDATGATINTRPRRRRLSKGERVAAAIVGATVPIAGVAGYAVHELTNDQTVAVSQSGDYTGKRPLVFGVDKDGNLTQPSTGSSAEPKQADPNYGTMSEETIDGIVNPTAEPKYDHVQVTDSRSQDVTEVPVVWDAETREWKTAPGFGDEKADAESIEDAKIEDFLKNLLGDPAYFVMENSKYVPTSHFKEAIANGQLLHAGGPVQLIGDPTVTYDPSGDKFGAKATFVVNGKTYAVTIGTTL